MLIEYQEESKQQQTNIQLKKNKNQTRNNAEKENQ